MWNCVKNLVWIKPKFRVDVKIGLCLESISPAGPESFSHSQCRSGTHSTYNESSSQFEQRHHKKDPSWQSKSAQKSSQHARPTLSCVHEQIFWLFVIIFHSIRTWRFFGLSMLKMKRSEEMGKENQFESDLKRRSLSWMEQIREKSTAEQQQADFSRDYKLLCFPSSFFMTTSRRSPSNKPAWMFSRFISISARFACKLFYFSLSFPSTPAALENEQIKQSFRTPHQQHASISERSHSSDKNVE